jgi:hypothetical protein
MHIMSRRRAPLDEGLADWLLKPIGDEPSPRDSSKFKKGDRVRDPRNPSRTGRVYRSIEWGKNRWKYGVEWDDGKVSKVTDLVEPMKESKMKKLNRRQLRKLVEGTLTEGTLMTAQERLSDCISDLYYAYRDQGMDGEEAVAAVESDLHEEAQGLMDSMVVNDPDGFGMMEF